MLQSGKLGRKSGIHGCGGRPRGVGSHGSGNVGQEPRPELAAAIQAERHRAARAHLAAIVRDTVAAGALYDDLARLSIRTTTGRSATLAERRREIDRLRHVVLRHPMTARHGEVFREFENAPSTQARSEGKEIAMEN